MVKAEPLRNYRFKIDLYLEYLLKKYWVFPVLSIFKRYMVIRSSRGIIVFFELTNSSEDMRLSSFPEVWNSEIKSVIGFLKICFYIKVISKLVFLSNLCMRNICWILNKQRPGIPLLWTSTGSSLRTSPSNEFMWVLLFTQNNTNTSYPCGKQKLFGKSDPTMGVTSLESDFILGIWLQGKEYIAPALF